MSNFLNKMQQTQIEKQAKQNSLGNLTPASIDSIVNQISTDIENRILNQATGQGMRRRQTEGNFITRTYEYRYYYTQVPVQFRQAPCTAICFDGGSEHDWDNEKYFVGIRNLDEAKQIAIAIMRRMYANKMQVQKPQKNKNGSTYFNPNWEFYTLDEIVRLIQKSTTLKLEGFSTSLYYIVSKTQQPRL